ncbi:MAG: exo-alpha-sialidase [Victivallales bacterium]|nr:exo-alpha-sialidase [Victivallales bacterium]
MKFVEVKHQPERSKSYIGSPSLVRLPDGALLASHDYFGQLYTLEGDNGLTSIYRSEDNGQTWENITHIINAYWGTMISLPDAVYHIGMTRDYGDMVVRRSTDGGFTWSIPKDEKTGIVMRGTPAGKPHQFRIETSGTELVYNGRVFKCFDKHIIDPGGPEWRADKFATGVMSADINSDLLDASNWTISNLLQFDYTKYNNPEIAGLGNGWLEGTLAPAPDGTLTELIRMHLKKYNKAGMLKLSNDGKELSFDYSNGIIDFIGGGSRFTVRRDPRTGLYVTFSNYVTMKDGEAITNRNRLCLAVSEDLQNWRIVRDALTDDTGLNWDMSIQLTGFQYCAWHFDGDRDIILLSRTAYRGANSFHNANRLTFHRFENWRNWL